MADHVWCLFWIFVISFCFDSSKLCGTCAPFASSCASIPVTVYVKLVVVYLTSCHGFSLCFAVVLLALDMSIFWLWLYFDSCPSIKLFTWFWCCNTVTQQWHQLLAGFQFEAAGTHSSFELAETWSLRFEIFAQWWNWLQIASEAQDLWWRG